MYWLKSLPTDTPQAEWTREEDEELLALEKKYYGRWEDVPYELSHTPYECDVRWFELSQPHFRDSQSISKKIPPKIVVLPARDASQLVSKEENKAENSVSGSGSAQLGIVAADNSTLRATREIDAAMISSVRNILGSVFNISVDDQVDDPEIIELRNCEEKAVELSKERDQLIKQKDSAMHEALLWRIELEKARDHVAFLEAAVRGAEERARNAEIDADAKDMEQRKTATLVEKKLLLAYINALQAQVQRSIKDVEWSDKNLDKLSKPLKMSSSQGYINPTTDDAQWKGNQAILDDLTTTDD